MKINKKFKNFIPLDNNNDPNILYDITMESKTSSTSESKESKASSSETTNTDILQQAAEFFMGEEFQDAIDSFVDDNFSLFADQTEIYADVDHSDSESEEYLAVGITREHSTLQHEAYARFQQLFEEKLETFVERQGVDRQGFLRACKQAVSDDALGIENMGTVFVDLLLATSEYEGFVTMMATQAKEKTHK